MNIYNEKVIVIKACGFDTAGIPLTPIVEQGAALSSHDYSSVLINRLTVDEIHRIRGESLDIETAEPKLSVEEAISFYAESIANKRPYFVTTRDKLPQEPLPELPNIFRNAWRYVDDSIEISLDAAKEVVKLNLRGLYRSLTQVLDDPFSGFSKEQVESMKKQFIELIQSNKIDACPDLTSLKQLYYDAKFAIENSKL